MNTKMNNLNICYDMIKEHYGAQVAGRSLVPYINHIEEGLVILDDLDVDTDTAAAYCLHPFLQNDGELRESYFDEKIEAMPKVPLMLAMEYRSVANESLSTDAKPARAIRLSALPPVNDMLRADKVQNYKDFMIHHYGKHERSEELKYYFEQWFIALRITDEQYNKWVKMIEEMWQEQAELT